MIAYAITSHFLNLEAFANRADMIVYRDKSTLNYAQNAKLFIREAKKHAFANVLLHRDYKLAYDLGADGVHLTSTQFNEIESAKSLGLFVVVSTHTEAEALTATKKGADMITLSPIFETPNKGNPKGLDFLLKISKLISYPIIALGGILTQNHIDACEEHGAKGFASIRYFAVQDSHL